MKNIRTTPLSFTTLYKIVLLMTLALTTSTTLAQTFVAADITGDTGESFGATMGDVDGDGDLDIYVANSSNQQNKLWINNGSGSFTAMDIAGDTGDSYGTTMGDVDGDGDLDIYVANNGQQNKLWINNGSGSFTAMDITGDTGSSRGATMGDVDGDGFMDIYVANSGEQNKLWLQVPPTYNVRFLDHDNTVLNTQVATSGTTAIPPTAPTRSGFTFTGWNPPTLTNITADTDFIAEYTVVAVSSSGSSGNSAGSRAKRLIDRGETEKAAELIERFPNAFDTNPNPTLPTLQQQLTELITKYKALTGRDPVLTNDTTNPQAILGTSDLTINDTGNDVELLQRFLMTEGYSIAAGATGFFGPQTRAALAQFQLEKSITPAQGYYGAITRVVIAAMYLGVSWR
mgnify:CR=1 FL=1